MSEVARSVFVRTGQVRPQSVPTGQLVVEKGDFVLFLTGEVEGYAPSFTQPDGSVVLIGSWSIPRAEDTVVVVDGID